VTRRRYAAAALATAVLLAAVLIPTVDVAEAADGEPVPPAPHLTARYDDQGNGWYQVVWLDAEGEVFDLGPEGRIPAPPRSVPGIAMPIVYNLGGGVPAMIRSAAGRYRLDAQRMLRIAACESRYQPGATSRGGHRGVFQFDGPTWAGRAPLAGVSADFAVAYDAGANVEVAASTMAAGQWWRWECQ
jgi:hypothetical protein